MLLEMSQMMMEAAFPPLLILALFGIATLVFWKPARTELTYRRLLLFLTAFTLFGFGWRLSISSVDSRRYIVILVALSTVWGAFGVHWVLEAARAAARRYGRPEWVGPIATVLVILLFSGLLLKMVRTDEKAWYFEQLRALIAEKLSQMRAPAVLTMVDGAQRMTYYTGQKSIELDEQSLTHQFLLSLWEGQDLFLICSERNKNQLQALVSKYIPAAQQEFLASVGKWRVYRLQRETMGYGFPVAQSDLPIDCSGTKYWLHEGFEQEGSELMVWGKALPSSQSAIRAVTGASALSGARSVEFSGENGLYFMRKPLDPAVRYRCTFRISAEEDFSLEVGRRDGNDYFWSGRQMGRKIYELSYEFPALKTTEPYNLMFSFSGGSCRLDELTIMQLDEP